MRKHLMTDVWTSVGVIGAVAAVAITGWLPLDPIIALAGRGEYPVDGVRLAAPHRCRA